MVQLASNSPQLRLGSHWRFSCLSLLSSSVGQCHQAWSCRDASTLLPTPSSPQPSRQLRLRQARWDSHRQGLVGRALIKSAIFCLLCFLSLPLSPLLIFVHSGRQGGRDSIFYSLLLLSRLRFPNLVTSGIHPGQVFFSPLSLGYPMHHRTASYQPSFYMQPNISWVRGTNAPTKGCW